MDLFAYTDPVYSTYIGNSLSITNSLTFPKQSQLCTPIYYTDKPTQIRLLKTSKLLKVQYL